MVKYVPSNIRKKLEKSKVETIAKRLRTSRCSRAEKRTGRKKLKIQFCENKGLEKMSFGILWNMNDHIHADKGIAILWGPWIEKESENVNLRKKNKDKKKTFLIKLNEGKGVHQVSDPQ